jgi:hypothetical protein
VKDYHTYFVGCDEWGFSVWAHNAGSGYSEATIRALLEETGMATEALRAKGFSPSKISKVRRAAVEMGLVDEATMRTYASRISPAERQAAAERWVAHRTDPANTPMNWGGLTEKQQRGVIEWGVAEGIIPPEMIPKHFLNGQGIYSAERAAAIFSEGTVGASMPGGKRFYDRTYAGRDIEFKADNFGKRARSAEEIDRMLGQIEKDAGYYARGEATPHWHFEHNPLVAAEMQPVLARLETAGIRWTSGSVAPDMALLTRIK